MVLWLLSIIIVLLIFGSWTLTISVFIALIPFVATKLYSPIIRPKFSVIFLGGDNLSWSLVILTLWITALALISRTYIRHHYTEYMSFIRLVVALAIILVGSFTVTNLLSFYFLFEAALIPIMIIIIVWGRSPERLQAGLYIIIYTVSASLPLLISLLYIYFKHGSLFIYFPVEDISPVIILIISIAMLVKFPLYGVHLWLPKAHVEAPVGGSILLAAILLKLGPYGIVRLITFFPNYYVLSPLLTSWGLLRALVAAMICIRQLDIKALVAYASISHIGLVLAGLIRYTNGGMAGARIILIGHGLASSGLFALVWFVYEWTKSRSLLVNRGLHHVAPGLSLFWFLLVAANIGVPPRLNIAGELYIFAGLVAVADEPPIIYGILILYSLLTMAYRLALYTGVNHGEVSPHVNYIWQRPIYFTIRFLHVVPLVLSFFILSVFL